jgi:hypothetical protein
VKLPCLGCRITAVFRWRRPANILLRPRFRDFRIPRQSSRGEGTLLIVSEHKVAKRTNRNHGLFPVQHEERINAFSIAVQDHPVHSSVLFRPVRMTTREISNRKAKNAPVTPQFALVLSLFPPGSENPIDCILGKAFGLASVSRYVRSPRRTDKPGL